MQPTAPESPSKADSASDGVALHVYLVDYNPTTLERFERWADDVGFQAHAYDSGRKFLDDPGWKQETGEQIFILHDGLPEVASLEALVELLPADSSKTERVWLLSHEFNANLRDVTKIAGVSGWLNRPLGKGTLKMLCRAYAQGNLHTPTPSELLDYHIKTGILSLQWQDEQLQLSGIMDEKSHFSRIKWLVPADIESITMNCDQLVSLNIEGLKEWLQFTKTDWAQERSFKFIQSPPMLQEFYDAMPELFGEKVTVEAQTPENSAQQADEAFDSAANDFVRNILLSPALDPNQVGEGFVTRYISCLTTLFRCSLSELYLTREGVLDHSSRLVARCNGIRRGLEHLTTEETFELPERFPLIPALLELYDPLVASLAAPTKLLQKSQQLLSGKCKIESYIKWLRDQQSLDSPPDWPSALERTLTETPLDLSSKLDFSTPFITGLFKALEIYLTGPLAQVDTTGVSVFQLIKTHTPGSDSVEELANKLRKSQIKDDRLALFRRDTLLSWRPDDSQLTLLARAGAMIRATAHEIQQIVQILDSHDALQQILGHRLSEIQLSILENDANALSQQLQQQAVTLLEKKVIGLYFNELAITFENEVELMGVSLF